MAKDLDAYFRSQGRKPPTAEEINKFCAEGVLRHQDHILAEAKRIKAERNKANG